MSEDRGTPNPAPAAWHVELSPELKGVLETRGWAEMEPAKAAAEILKSYRELETYRGVPPERLLKLPAKNELEAPEEWRAVWNRLGAPTEPAGYEMPEGTGEDLAAALRASYASLGVPADKAKELTASVSKFIADRDASAAAAADNSVEEQEKLKANWGKNYDRNLHLARAGAAAAGIPPEGVQAMEKVTGFAATMEHFLKLGMGTKEAQYVTGQNSGPLSREQAIAEREALKHDQAWVAKYLAGDVEKRKQMHALNVIIAGVDA